jgi:hypothetical protein
VQWRVPEAKLGLMWVRDRRGSVRVLSNGRAVENPYPGDANLWFFPAGFDAEGELVGRSATALVREWTWNRALHLGSSSHRVRTVTGIPKRVMRLSALHPILASVR